MRKIVLLAAILLSGCATVANDARTASTNVYGTTQEVTNSIPAAVGTVVGAVIFGGTVATPIDPGWYVADSVNREFRIFFNKQRRNTQREIAKQIQ
jgi:hypothetical protein